MSTAAQRVRIGGACGFWGDSAMATPQLLQVPGLQYLVYDYLAESTMAILAKARAWVPNNGSDSPAGAVSFRRLAGEMTLNIANP